METTWITVICNIHFPFQKSKFIIIICIKQQFDIITYTKKVQFNLVNFSSNYRVFEVLFIPTYANSSHMFIVFLILNSWETDLQMSDFLLIPFFVFQISQEKNQKKTLILRRYRHFVKKRFRDTY